MPLRVLCVAEKNDAAREISRLLSGNKTSKREGASKYNKIYEFSCQMLNSDARVAMTSVSGHLMALDFSINFKNWGKCLPLSLFSAPIIKYFPENSQPIKTTLEREAKKSEALVLWTDCDREGENIASQIRDVCTSANYRIKVYRARFSEITFRSVKAATERLEGLDERQAAAVECRQELDLRIGAAFTRFLTLRLQKVFPTELSDQLISYGPCQFPTLGFVVDRYKQVQQFVPETFFKLKAVLSRDSNQVEFSWSRGRLFNRSVAEIFLQVCLDEPVALVTRVASKPKSKWRPLPLDTVEFEKLSSRKLQINAKQAMAIAEKLYTQGLISYPRTETNLFPSSMDLVPLVQEQTQDPQWGDKARQILADNPNPRRGNKSDQAHPPIHPLKYTHGLQGNEKKVYEFIVRHFLACCSKDAQGMETTVDISVNEEVFSASGLVITDRNYLDVYPYDRWTDRNMPRFSQGESQPADRVELVEGETTPPPLLKEADLIGLMEKHGIGTDATHAEHIETIKSRRYVGVQPDGTFLPGTLGMGLVEGYDEIGQNMAKPYLRAELEADLKAICLGEKRKEEVIETMVHKYKQAFIEITENAVKIDQSLSNYFGPPHQLGPGSAPGGGEEGEINPLAKCRRCLQFDMYFRSTREDKWILSCAGFPDCKCGLFFPSNITHARTELSALCHKCPHPPVHQARLTFQAGTMPYFLQGPGPNEFVGCVFCNEDLKKVGIELRYKNQPPAPTAIPAQQTPLPNSYSLQNNTRPHSSIIPSNRRDLGFDPITPNPLVSAAPVKRYAEGTAVASKLPKVSITAETEENFVVCNCGVRASLLTVRKEGPNTGRQFYTCSTKACDYFLWDPTCDPSLDANQPKREFVKMPDYIPPAGDGFIGLYPPVASGQDTVMCHCRIQAKLLTVMKQGPNEGRQFYKCSKPREQVCRFFQWSEEIPVKTEPPAVSGQDIYIPPSLESFGSLMPPSDSPPCVECRCGEQAKLMTVNKEGANQGRQFYSCSKPREQGCGFFQWADEDSGARTNCFSPPQRGGARTNCFSPPRRGGASRGGGRLCSVCRHPGHTKKNCPNASCF